MDAEAHNISPGEQRKSSSGDQVVGRQRPAHHQEEYCSDICGGCIQCLICLIFAVDLMACRLNRFTNAMAHNNKIPISQLVLSIRKGQQRPVPDNT